MHAQPQTDMHTTPQLQRRHLVRALALATALVGTSALAQTWPAKPIPLVVPFPAGGTTDMLACALTEKLTLGHTGSGPLATDLPGGQVTIE